MVGARARERMDTREMGTERVPLPPGAAGAQQSRPGCPATRPRVTRFGWRKCREGAESYGPEDEALYEQTRPALDRPLVPSC